MPLDKSLQVFEVRDYLPKPQLPRKIHPDLPDVPGVMLFIMRCKQGKTNFIANMNLSSQFFGGKTPIFDLTYIICPTLEADPSSQGYFREELKDRFIITTDMSKIEPLIKDITDYQLTFDRRDPDNLPSLINIYMDDISGHIKRNAQIADLFTRYRHYMCNLILSNQQLKGIPTVCREMATSVFLGKCFSDKEKEKVDEEWGDLYKNRLVPAWEYCTKEEYNYCYLRLDQQEPAMYRIGKDGFEKVDYMQFTPNKISNTERIKERMAKYAKKIEFNAPIERNDESIN